jgi:hypothetical protein
MYICLQKKNQSPEKVFLKSNEKKWCKLTGD